MNFKIGSIVFIIALSIAINACVPRLTKPKEFYCPPPEQNCSAIKWAGVPYDTSTSVTKNLDSFYVFEPVRQINTPGDEWALSFITAKKALLTFTDANQQKAMIVRMLEDNKGSLESGIGLPLDASSGPYSFHDNDVVFSAVLTEGMIGNSDLYTAKLNGNLLSDVKKMDDNINATPVSWESQPAFSPDGNVIFFASDILNDTKGTDIFFTVKIPDGKWSNPVNCGESINSKCDELTPFVTKNGKKLLFSSSGHETIGGYDIFSSDISDEFWDAAKRGDLTYLKNTKNLFSPPVNLGSPLNTSADELFPTSPDDIDSLLYYSSNQSSADQANLIMMKGGFDIFVRRKITKIKLPLYKPKEIAEAKMPEIPQTYVLEGVVFNAKTNEKIPNANITVKEHPDLGTYKETTTDDQGKYKISLQKNREYEVVAQARDLFFDSFTMSVDSKDTATVIKKDIHVPESLTLRINFPTNEYKNPYNFTMDSNGVETNVSWLQELDMVTENILKSKDFVEKITFVGHTDDVGSEEYNQKLGQRRVDFIIAQLIKRGVPAKMLEGRSAGKLELLPQRTDEDVSMWRKRCRRVELQKIFKV